MEMISVIMISVTQNDSDVDDIDDNTSIPLAVLGMSRE